METQTRTRAEEQECIGKVLSGDSAAFGMLVDRYQKPLLSFIYNRLRDPGRVEDIGQETFIKAYRALGSHDPARASFSTWLYAIARNACIDEMRRPALVETGLDDLDESLLPTREGDREAGFVRLERALAALPEEQQEIFDLVCTQGLALDEAAVIADCPIGTVKSRLNRAREALRRTVLGTTAFPEGTHGKT